ncbi:MAG: hypothetical protein KJP21_00870 [Bacteroidia bacterium]|nr:hypothetical protein [Bacteroidia bacterium]NNJ56829.1 hypothetical protein [Bacteroidia bacterium]
MNKNKIACFVSVSILFLASCSSNNKEFEKQKGISLEQTTENENINDLENNQQFNDLKTRPGKVLLTGHNNHRLISIFKVNYSKRTKKTFTGSNGYHSSYSYDDYGNSRYRSYMPGLSVTYGYNMLNISHYNLDSNKRNTLFKKPVLINNLYYPTLSKDSINNAPVLRNYYLASVYNEDTNNDSLINHKDLRRFFMFNLDGTDRSQLIPNNYGVLSSQYDAPNDYMIIKAKIDQNNNGKMDEEEAIHIFWIDLNDPRPGVRMY